MSSVNDGDSDAERAAGIYAGVVRLTHSLQDSLRELGLDSRLTRIAGNDIPDACVRLDYVVQMTETAAHRTLDLVDDGRAIADVLRDVGAHLGGSDPLVPDTHRAVADAESRLRQTLTSLAQAQEYQDLSGQVIRRVIGLVRDVESALLELLGADAFQSAQANPVSASEPALPGPAVPGARTSTGATADQSDADQLLAGLGF